MRRTRHSPSPSAPWWPPSTSYGWACTPPSPSAPPASAPSRSSSCSSWPLRPPPSWPLWRHTLRALSPRAPPTRSPPSLSSRPPTCTCGSWPSHTCQGSSRAAAVASPTRRGWRGDRRTKRSAPAATRQASWARLWTRRRRSSWSWSSRPAPLRRRAPPLPSPLQAPRLPSGATTRTTRTRRPGGVLARAGAPWCRRAGSLSRVDWRRRAR
mmetsp:Transcript_4108/g.17243  ORF Transcript_4108/g.17243 Transcript_4108/m.17243 type:complete len:211 (-) Transcript_4108:1250-1882(-)